ncbi:MAG: hypothetical protein U0903_18910 [Planctomycetales bacterium]
MPLISATQIPQTIRILEEKGLSLYHACHYADLLSYLNLGGIPTRSLLSLGGHPFTAYETDAIDHANDIWDKVFFNFSDFGFWFFRGGTARSLPNPFGPILLQLNPSILTTAAEVCISLVSASRPGFSREIHGLGIDDVSRLFTQKPNTGQRWFPKMKHELQQDFPSHDVASPELHCSFPGDLAPFQNYLTWVTIDPVPQLADTVRPLFRQHDLQPRFVERGCPNENHRRLYEQILIAARLGIRTLKDFQGMNAPEEYTRNWINTVQQWDRDSFQFRRFTEYTTNGTLIPLHPVEDLEQF